ncbi:Uncharacterized protein Adt_30060 [Abeliophyllum distichum]|uniref:Uncharacterized protein n=1 Tax=Abeliophyllum distichum TaxID=126358 RepID=A0ABD1RDL7_9LAMI
MDESTLANQHLHLPYSSIQVRDLFDDTGWSTDRLLELVSYTIAEQVRSIHIIVAVHNQIMWKDTSDGRFATKSALAASSYWQLVHTIQAVYNMIWSSIILTTVSFFCWRLWQGLIPIDIVIQDGL